MPSAKPYCAFSPCSITSSSENCSVKDYDYDDKNKLCGKGEGYYDAPCHYTTSWVVDLLAKE